MPHGSPRHTVANRSADAPVALAAHSTTDQRLESKEHDDSKITVLGRAKLKEATRAIEIYVDGSFRYDANGHSAGGIGVFFGKDDERNVSDGLLPGCLDANSFELMAILRALQCSRPHADVLIWSDSKFALDHIDHALKDLQADCRISSSLSNAHLIAQCAEDVRRRMNRGYTTRLRWIKGHDGNNGNVAADEMAGAARKRLSKSGAEAPATSPSFHSEKAQTSDSESLQEISEKLRDLDERLNKHIGSAQARPANDFAEQNRHSVEKASLCQSKATTASCRQVTPIPPTAAMRASLQAPSGVREWDPTGRAAQMGAESRHNTDSKPVLRESTDKTLPLRHEDVSPTAGRWRSPFEFMKSMLTAGEASEESVEAADREAQLSIRNGSESSLQSSVGHHESGDQTLLAESIALL